MTTDTSDNAAALVEFALNRAGYRDCKFLSARPIGSVDGTVVTYQVTTLNDDGEPETSLVFVDLETGKGF